MSTTIERKFLGFDLSTQKLKAIVIDTNLKICHHVVVDFDVELPSYGTNGGFIRNLEEPNAVTGPVYMWLEALELCMVKLKGDGLIFDSISCISGCAQQHGSVWWKLGAENLVRNMNSNKSIIENLRVDDLVFTMKQVPVWLDSSTSEECKLIETNLGGANKVAKITGCRAFERFTGPQIAKIHRLRREVFETSERISLISNFLSTILVGKYTPFDVSDAAGMNMMDIRKKRWSLACLSAILGYPAKACKTTIPSGVSNLLSKLGVSGEDDQNIVDSERIIGRISGYFIERFGFSPECLISSFTGDTLSSMAGLCVEPDQLLISLGTSDTSCFFLKKPIINSNGHISLCPHDPSMYVGLIGFKNGSKTRERIRDQFANGDWNQFRQLLHEVPRGNYGCVAFYFDMREIYPLCKGDYRFYRDDSQVELKTFGDPAFEIRACLEGQFMRLYNHLAPYLKSINRIIITGGASTNESILFVAADIFGKPVKAMNMPDSGCLGGAYMARYAWEIASNSSHLNRKPTFKDVIVSRLQRSHWSSNSNQLIYPLPREILKHIYPPLMKRYKKLEDRLNEESTKSI